MEEQDKPEFGQLLEDTFAAYGKAMPSDEIMLGAWLKMLEPFPFPVIVKAMRSYAEEETKFSPVPVAIAKLCKLMDGRPGVEEAWAIALTAGDESNTLVWTPEIAEAFNLCRPMIDKDELISARMMFKEAYTKLVANARLNFKPVKWQVSIGTDATRRQDALQAAVTAGLLPAPAVAVLIGYESKEDEPVSSHGLMTLKEQLANLKLIDLANEEILREREKKLAREATAHCKAKFDSLVKNHE